jgi:hypothetical protein
VVKLEAPKAAKAAPQQVCLVRLFVFVHAAVFIRMWWWSCTCGLVFAALWCQLHHAQKLVVKLEAPKAAPLQVCLFSAGCNSSWWSNWRHQKQPRQRQHRYVLVS